MHKFETIPSGNNGKKSVLDKIKPNFLKRREALQEAKDRGFESLEDFEVEEIKIDRIEKNKIKQNVSHWDSAVMEEITGTLKINCPLIGKDLSEMQWEIITHSFSWLLKAANLENAEFIWSKKDNQHDHFSVSNSSLPGFILERMSSLGISYNEALDIFSKISKNVYEKIKNHVEKYAMADVITSSKFHDSSFEIRSDISSKTEEGLQKELADSLERGTVDGKFIYIMGGAEKFLEVVREEGYENIRVEKEIIQNNLEELKAETGDVLFDFGCGDGSKAKPILERSLEDNKKTKYCPVDISARMIFEAANNAPEGTETEGLLFDFTKDFKDKIPADKKATLAIFGSTLGNGDAEHQEKLMNNLGSAMKIGDNAMIGLQLNYDFQEILKKYKDPQVASFAEPMLEKLGIGKEDVELFISGDEKEKTISLNIKMLNNKEIKVGKNAVNLPKGKIINLIVSHKYEIPEMEHLAQISGLQIKKSFLDPESSYGLFVLEK